jgi:hypothetical protein
MRPSHMVMIVWRMEKDSGEMEKVRFRLCVVSLLLVGCRNSMPDPRLCVRQGQANQIAVRGRDFQKTFHFFSCVFTCGSTTTTVTFNEKNGGEKVHHHIKDNDILSITPAAVTIKENSKPCHRRSLSRTAVCSWLHWLARSLNLARGCFQNTARARLPSLCLH